MVACMGDNFDNLEVLLRSDPTDSSVSTQSGKRNQNRSNKKICGDLFELLSVFNFS